MKAFLMHLLLNILHQPHIRPFSIILYHSKQIKYFDISASHGSGQRSFAAKCSSKRDDRKVTVNQSQVIISMHCAENKPHIFSYFHS